MCTGNNNDVTFVGLHTLASVMFREPRLVHSHLARGPSNNLYRERARWGISGVERGR